MKERNYGIDLLRIVSAMMVTMLHVLKQGGILTAVEPNTANYWIAWLLEIGAYCAVNCFAIITGYVMVDREVKAKNFISLWLHALFYSILIGSFPLIFAPKMRTLKNVLLLFFPITSELWWYVSSYFALLLCVPFINVAIKNVPQRTFRTVLIAVLFGIGILDCLVDKYPYGLQAGYSTFWLLIVYLFGAYFKMYGFPERFTAGKALLGFLGAVLLTLGSKAVLCGAGMDEYSNAFISYTSVTITICAICLLRACVGISVKGVGEKAISFLAPVSLGVYLIHVHPFIFNYVIKDAFADYARMSAPAMFVNILSATLLVYTICVIAEWLRILLFRLLRIPKFSEKLGGRIDPWILKSEQCHKPLEEAP